jgi:hypothetical protein
LCLNLGEIGISYQRAALDSFLTNSSGEGKKSVTIFPSVIALEIFLGASV